MSTEYMRCPGFLILLVCFVYSLITYRSCGSFSPLFSNLRSSHLSNLGIIRDANSQLGYAMYTRQVNTAVLPRGPSEARESVGVAARVFDQKWLDIMDG